MSRTTSLSLRPDGVSRIAVVADTHMRDGRPEWPAACLDVMRGADAIVHAGDLVSPAVLAAIQELCPVVVAVHGNVDVPSVVRALPETHVLQVGRASIGVVHDAGPASGRLERMRKRFPACAAVVFGHSHIPLHETAEDGFQIFNPGSPTTRRRQPRHTMGVATVHGARITFEHIALD